MTNIAFFKDVTFGILYEQFKASEKLQNIINETINDKIGLPLDSLVNTCNYVQNSDELQDMQINNP